MIRNTLPNILGNPESLKKESEQLGSSSTNGDLVGEDFLKVF